MQNTSNIIQITDRGLSAEWIAEFNLETREVIWRDITSVAILTECVKKQYEESWKNSIKEII